MTIKEAFEKFLYERSSYCSTQTLLKYRDDMKIFFRFLIRRYEVDPGSSSFDQLAGESVLMDFIIYERERNEIRNSSIRSYGRSIKAFLRWCYEEDLCEDYLKRVRMPKDDAPPKMPLYANEVQMIDALFNLDDPKGLRNYCIFHLLLDCGLRRQEVVHLKYEDLDRERNIITILDSKGFKSRMTLIPDFVLDKIYLYSQKTGISSGVIFWSLRGKSPITDNSIKQLFQDLKVETEINRLHAHLLRHTFATSYLIGGGNLEYLRVFMGHTDYAVTQKYASLAAQLKMLGAEIYRLDPIFFTRGY